MMVLGTTRVLIKDCVMRLVEIDMVAGSVSVDISVEPSKDIVLKTVDAGCVKVDIELIVMTLAGMETNTFEV